MSRSPNTGHTCEHWRGPCIYSASLNTVRDVYTSRRAYLVFIYCIVIYKLILNQHCRTICCGVVYHPTSASTRLQLTIIVERCASKDQLGHRFPPIWTTSFDRNIISVFTKSGHIQSYTLTAKTMGITHIVCFQFKADATPEAIDEVWVVEWCFYS